MTASELGGATASWGPPWSSSSCGQHIGSGTGGRWRTWRRSSAVLAGRMRSVPRLPRARGQPTSGASTASIRIAGWGALTTHSRINEVLCGYVCYASAADSVSRASSRILAMLKYCDMTGRVSDSGAVLSVSRRPQVGQWEHACFTHITHVWKNHVCFHYHTENSTYLFIYF